MAISTILDTTRVALASVDLGLKEVTGDWAGDLGQRQIFRKVWLGLAGIGHQSDVNAFAPLVRQAFNIAEGDEEALRITNGECKEQHSVQILTNAPRVADGHLLASPCASLPNVDSTVALVAGTGTVGLGEWISRYLVYVVYRSAGDLTLITPSAFTKRGKEIDLVAVSGGWGYL